MENQYHVSAVGVMLPRLTDWTDLTDKTDKTDKTYKTRKKWLVVKKTKGAVSSNSYPLLLVSWGLDSRIVRQVCPVRRVRKSRRTATSY